MVPKDWPAGLSEFGAFGSELGVVCVGRRHKRIVGNERKVICFNQGNRFSSWFSSRSLALGHHRQGTEVILEWADVEGGGRPSTSEGRSCSHVEVLRLG